MYLVVCVGCRRRCRHRLELEFTLDALLCAIGVREVCESMLEQPAKDCKRDVSTRETRMQCVCVHRNVDNAEKDDRLGHNAEKMGEDDDDDEETAEIRLCVCVLSARPEFERQNTKSVCQITMEMFSDAMSTYASLTVYRLETRGHDKLALIFSAIATENFKPHTHARSPN